KEDMARIARYPAPGDETELAQAYLALKDAVKELRRLGDLNGRVLQARIDTKNHLLKILGAGVEPTTYAR
ncbi:MAG TPA: hypothetical protein VN369_02740, partial [Terriglobales bacterium]|nr:hypothetical protein [Terriglobales bacterium]